MGGQVAEPTGVQRMADNPVRTGQVPRARVEPPAQPALATLLFQSSILIEYSVLPIAVPTASKQPLSGRGPSSLQTCDVDSNRDVPITPSSLPLY